MVKTLSVTTSDGLDTLNPYEKVVILAKRARQIVEFRRAAFYTEIEEMGINRSDPEQLINIDGWQEILAITFEEKAHPLEIAKKELAAGDITYSYIGHQKKTDKRVPLP